MKRIVTAICTGTARPFNGAETSAIAKYPREGIVQLLADGFAPDEQADRRVHGGPDKAVHLYPLDHHAFWRNEIADHPLLGEPGAFGSNLAVEGLSEDQVHIGDRFALGSAELEISQPRQPCWKVDHRFGQRGMTARIVTSGRCGWYFRVIKTGEAQAGDTLERVATGETNWSVARAFAALVAGKPTRAELEELAAMPTLAQGQRERALKRLAQGLG